jgi:hypothetical protein
MTECLSVMFLVSVIGGALIGGFIGVAAARWYYR